MHKYFYQFTLCIEYSYKVPYEVLIRQSGHMNQTADTACCWVTGAQARAQDCSLKNLCCAKGQTKGQRDHPQAPLGPLGSQAPRAFRLQNLKTKGPRPRFGLPQTLTVPTSRVPMTDNLSQLAEKGFCPCDRQRLDCPPWSRPLFINSTTSIQDSTGPGTR